MSTVERAKQIRAALKALKISSRQVSVKSDSFSMGSAIDVVIKDPKIPLSIVKQIAEEHEAIRRCELSGEILGGGNRYVSVEYSDEAEKALAAPYVDAVAAALAKAHGPYHADVDGVPGASVSVGHNGYGVVLWGAHGRVGEYSSPEGAASAIGRLVLEAA